MLSVSLSSAPQNVKSFSSIFLSKTSHTPRSPMKSQNPSNDDVDFVLNCSKRVLPIFQNFKHHNELCEECVKLVERAIKVLEETKNLSNNRRARVVGSNEYNKYNNLIFEIEFYLRKYDRRTAVQSEVKESIQNFAFNLESCINSFQQVYETEKSRKSGWNPSVISKVKTIGRLIALSKDPEPIKQDECDDDNDDNSVFEYENPNRLIIQQELINSTGIYRGANNVRKGNFISEEVAEKYVGNISMKSPDFSEFQKEIIYLNKLSRDCNNILSVNGYFERNGLWIVEEWAEYDLMDYLRSNPNLDWKIKLAIARGIANALSYIHDLDTLHYNVKIDSVMLNRDLEPKLYKFGKDADDCFYLKSVQSLEPMAPEVKRNETYTFASEVYSFGLILWEIATQDYQSVNEFVESRYVDGAPINYLTLMEKALSKEPQNRPTMQEMFDSLSELESAYNIRCQKKLSAIDMTYTSSVSSNSSEESTISINESLTSCITSRASSPTTSDDDSISIPINEIVDIEKAYKLHEKCQYSKAFKLFNEYNKQNPSSSVAKYWLGLYYYKGYYKSPKLGPKQAIKLSLKYFGEAAKLNHADAQYYYSRILLNNPSMDGEENRFQIALEYLKKASNQNHPASMRWLGTIMRKGEFGCKKDVETSKILIDRSKRLSKSFAESRNTSTSFKGNVNQRKPRTTSNTSTTTRPVVISNQASKRNTMVFKDLKPKTARNNLDRRSTVF